MTVLSLDAPIAILTVGSVALFAVGLVCLMTQRNVVKQVIGLRIMLQGTAVSLIAAARLHGEPHVVEAMIVSALVLETIIVALALALIVHVYRHYPSGDVDSLSELRG